jgi:RNA polymerase sigma factor (sigma-70 family)
MTMITTLDYSSLPDRRLVELHLMGDRAAFGQIVTRYQAMVCALGVSACGDIGQSEDLAQEVFLAAWRQLPALRDPEKLRGWLAGISRNLIHNSLRRRRRTPTARAESLSPETPSGGDGPRERAIRADEAALMWAGLEGIPENYREPMVLFYREQRSVAAVAATLEISEDAVRQRLARGRALLSERMAKGVAETLERSAPTPAFAGTVLLAMPAQFATAVAAPGGATAKLVAAASGLVAAATKGGLAVKALATVGLLPAVLNGTVEFLKFRTRYETSDSAAQRNRIMATYLKPHLLAAGLLLAFVLACALTLPGSPLGRMSLPFWLLGAVATLGLPIVAMVLVRRWSRRMERGGRAENEAAENEAALITSTFEYRSQRSVLGLPLMHVRLRVGDRTVESPRMVRGWIAVGDGVALGGLFAHGGRLAIAPLSTGPGAIGLASLGIFSLGLGAIGGLAGGVFSYGIIAFGWSAARAVTFAGARTFAEGYYALGQHANDAVAAAFFRDDLFFHVAAVTASLVGATLWCTWILPLLLTGWYVRARKSAAKRRVF